MQTVESGNEAGQPNELVVLANEKPPNLEDLMNIKSIPGTLGFSVSDCGEIYGPEGEHRPQYVNGDGYRTASVKLLDGKWQTFGVHRLVALAHIPTDKDVSQLAVNHIDHDIANNEAYNLEWVSAYLNNLHASMMRQQIAYPTIVMTDKEGRKSFINNLHDASSLLNMDLDLVWEMVRDGRSIDGVGLEPYTRHSRVPDQLRKATIQERDPIGRAIQSPVTIKDLETGAIESFDSIADAALRHGVSPSHVYQCISGAGRTRLFKKQYLVVRESAAFPDVTPEQLDELRAPGGKETVARNKLTDETAIFPSAASMIKILGLSKKAVSTRLRKDGLGEVGDWFFAYKNRLEDMMARVKSSSSPYQPH